MSPARPLGPARLVLTFVLLSALFLLALLAECCGCWYWRWCPPNEKRKEHDP